MDDQAKFQRMLEMLIMISGSFGYKIEALAKRFETSPRTIYRYINTFRAAGFLVSNKNGFVKIDKSSPDYKDLSKLIHFSEEEAFVLSKAIHAIDDENKFKNELYQKLYYLFDSEKAIHKLVPRKKSENVLRLKDAIQNEKQVILKKYRSSNSEKIRDRKIEPFDFTSNYLYVWGYDYADATCKTFKIARASQVILTDESWKNKRKHKKKEIDTFRMSGDKKNPVKLKLSLIAYNLITEEFPKSEKFIKKTNDNSYLFTGWVCKFDGVGRFILGLPGEVEVIAPKELRAFLSDKSKKNIF
jgi:predicted DNA-binding transcriptional regulator YafY